MLSESQIKSIESNIIVACEKCDFTNKNDELLVKSMINVALSAIIEYDKIKSQS